MTVERSLWSQVRTVLTDLDSFNAVIKTPACLYQDRTTSFHIDDEYRRFYVWASNIAALQGPKKRSSLDYRLNEAPQIRQQIARLLDRLSEASRRAALICKGVIPNREDDDSESEDAGPTEQHEIEGAAPTRVFEIEELCLSISGLITRLFRLSMAIRNPTPRDRYAKIATIKEIDSTFDIAHVREKFPIINQEIWLAERLGKANSQRRDYFRYRRKHKERLAHEEEEEKKKQQTQAEQEVGGPRFQGFKKAAFSYPAESSLGSTKASTYVQPDEIKFDMGDADAASDTGVSETSFATSVEENSSSFLRVPPPPVDLNTDVPFICPYCFLVQAPTTSRAWKRHIYNDLHPYVCTFEACPAKPFASRRTWFDHELQMHRKEWLCSLCDHSPLSSATSFEAHIKQSHGSEVTVKQLKTMVDTCSESLDQLDPADCPLCDEWAEIVKSRELLANPSSHQTAIVVTPEQFRRHLARHLEQLALFALPRHSANEGSDGGSSNEAVMDPSSADLSLAELSDQDSIASDHEEEEIFGYIGKDASYDDNILTALKKGMNINVFNKHGVTALWQATRYNSEEMLLLLLSHGADCNIANSDNVGEIPLHVACEFGYTRKALILLERGADANAMTIAGHTALYKAIKPNNVELVWRMLHHGADCNLANSDLVAETPLHAAVELNLTSIIKTLLDAGADPNAKTADGYTTLHLAAGNGTDDCVRLLCDAGADVNASGENGITPLQVAKNVGLESTVRYLRSLGAVETRKPEAGRKDTDGIRLRVVVRMQRLFRMHKLKIPGHPRAIPVGTIRSFADAAWIVVRYMRGHKAQQFLLLTGSEYFDLDKVQPPILWSSTHPPGRLFDAFIKNIYDYLIYTGPVVVDHCPSGLTSHVMRKFYADFKVDGEVHLWSSIFDEEVTEIDSLYESLQTHQEPGHPNHLDASGFRTWMQLMLHMKPQIELERLVQIARELQPAASRTTIRIFRDHMVQALSEPDQDLYSSFDEQLFKCSRLKPRATGRRPPIIPSSGRR